ncbi:hypothetical protein NM688_g4647 [Phlebia brevispora]|uniref:Uncharacterized protein n=1 Tax=Phlebia brevispora TaxID=194682 RepID=A0ACC1T2J5_9APHY|nr:hypothetical protein NM688_g4647 [Phlebia brevispora]
MRKALSSDAATSIVLELRIARSDEVARHNDAQLLVQIQGQTTISMASDEKKKMWNAFEECGIFATACCHGFCEQLCDMIRSGELAKYLIAMVVKMLDALEEELGIGYNIGCYKGRTQLSKALQKHSKVIKRAIAAYNVAAAALTPPKEPLDWDTVADCNFIEEFNMLDASRTDVARWPWCTIKIREAMKLHHRIAHAHEELQQCAVELRRLHTAIRNEPHLFRRVFMDLDAANDPLHGAVFEFTQFWEKVNARIMRRIWEVYDHCDDYEWTKELGIRLETQAPSPDASSEPRPDQNDIQPDQSANREDEDEDDEDEDDEDEDDDDNDDDDNDEDEDNEDEDDENDDEDDDDEDESEEEVQTSVATFIDYVSSVQ